MLILQVTCPTSNAYCEAAIRKNGSEVTGNWGNFGNSEWPTAQTVTIVDMNGTTDYLEAYGEVRNGTTIGSQPTWSYFTGTLIAPYGQGGGGGGDASVAGNDTEIQFNDGGSALGADAEFTWNKTTNKLTVTGDIEYTGVIRDTSDRRLKKEIAVLPANMLDKIMLNGMVEIEASSASERGKITEIRDRLIGRMVDRQRFGIYDARLSSERPGDNLRHELDGLRGEVRAMKRAGGR